MTGHTCPLPKPQWPKLSELKTVNGQLEIDMTGLRGDNERLKAENAALSQKLQAQNGEITADGSDSTSPPTAGASTKYILNLTVRLSSFLLDPGFLSAKTTLI
jgi:hypothetical protein